MSLNCKALQTFIVCGALVAAFAIADRAHASPLPVDLLDPGNTNLGFYFKNFPAETEQTIFLENGNGTTVKGNTGTQTGLPIVNLTGTQTLNPSNGNATIKPVTPATSFDSLTFSIPSVMTTVGNTTTTTNYTFTDFEFSIQLTDPGKTGNVQNPFDFTMTAFDGATQLGTLTLNNTNDSDLKTSADLPFLVLAEGANVITSVVLSSTSGFDEMKQFSVSGIASTITTITKTATPIPAALPLFASGLGALGLFGWRRKRKARLSA